MPICLHSITQSAKQPWTATYNGRMTVENRLQKRKEIMSAADERVELTRRIIDNEISRSDVVREIRRIENQYGELAFPAFSVQEHTAPWNQAYYEELKLLRASGASSQEFILRLVEVRDACKAQQERKKKIIIGAAAAIIVVGATILLMKRYF